MKKKAKIWSYLLVVMGFVFFLMSGCEKDDDNGINFNRRLTYGTVSDIDGNVYKTITIGTQTWMAENLKVSRYRNGEFISNVTDNSSWMNLTTGAYCDYDNDPKNSKIYGKLYNFYAVKDSRNLCPIGWHVPSVVELNTLIYYLDGWSQALIKLKEAGATHWPNSNYQGDNASGFTALPGGMRDIKGDFCNIGLYGCWWLGTEGPDQSAWIYLIDDKSWFVQEKFTGINGGFSVRCIKD